MNVFKTKPCGIILSALSPNNVLHNLHPFLQDKKFYLSLSKYKKNPVQILTYSSFNCLKNTYSSAKVLTKEFREVISSRQKRHSAPCSKLSGAADDKQKRQFYHQPFLQIQNAKLKFFFEIRVEGPQTVAFLYANISSRWVPFCL